MVKPDHDQGFGIRNRFTRVTGMMDFEKARTKMVDNQIRTVDVTHHALIDALLEVPRELFVDEENRLLAYIDEDLQLQNAASPRFLMEPAPFARLAQLADIQSGDVVLDIGCATGYSSAVLSHLAETVVAVEEDVALAEHATKTLADLGHDNVAVVEGPLNKGCPGEAPFDTIFIGGAVEVVPDEILDQLKDGGKLVAVVGLGNSASATVYLRDGKNITPRKAFNCAVLPLPGFQKTPEFVF